MKKALLIIRSINLLVLAIVTLDFANNFNGFVFTAEGRFENLLFVAGFVIIIEVVVNLLIKWTEEI